MEPKIDDNKLNILDLNNNILQKIMKYIIANCDEKNWRKYADYTDLISFALAHERFEHILKFYHYGLYISLFEALQIDFSELETKHSEKRGDAFWDVFANSIRKNKIIPQVTLKYDPESFQPNFVDHFELIKRALEHKENLLHVRIELNGYSLDDLINFNHIRHLDLDVRMSAEALVEVCKSNPHLEILCFRSTEILGRLSDIAPHCRNLTHLMFAPKPDIDGVEYAPLAKLPKLREMILHAGSENGPFFSHFEQSSYLTPLKMTFSEILPHLRNFNIARANSFFAVHLTHNMHLRALYDFRDISRDNSLSKHSLKIDYKGLTLYECPTSDTDISGFISILKLFNIKTLRFKFKTNEIAKLFASITSDESLALKSIDTGSIKIDQPVTSELVKIQSITSLSCTFSDWESVELLIALTNLETVHVEVEKEFQMTTSKALCSLINTCSASGVIYSSGCYVKFRNIESIISPRKRMTALKIEGSFEEESLSHILKDFRSYRDLITIEELDVLKCVNIKIKDLLKMADVHPIKKLRISLANTNDIDSSDLAELEELTPSIDIEDSVKGSLIKLFDQMAKKTSQSLQCLKISSKELSREELLLVSQIRSLKKLDLCDSVPEDCASLMELANWNIEELILPSSYALLDLFSAFAAKSTSRLQHLKIKGEKSLELRELKVLFKIKTLKSLQCTCLNKDVSFLRNFKHLVKLDIKLLRESNLEGLRSLAELEQLESLTLRLNEYSLLNHSDFLADIQNLKELNLLGAIDYNINLTSVYQAFVSKNVKLTHLTTMIGCVEEVNQITHIKTLRKLHLASINIVRSFGKKLTSLGELSELESLQLTELYADEFITTDSDDDNTLDSDGSIKMDCVLPILRCCRNLDRLLINSVAHLADINTQLKSIRDPTVQGPLTVILTEVEDINEEYNIPEILVVDFENVYMKVVRSRPPAPRHARKGVPWRLPLRLPPLRSLFTKPHFCELLPI